MATTLDQALKMSSEDIYYVSYFVDQDPDEKQLRVFASSTRKAKKVAHKYLEGEFGSRYRISSISCV